MGIRIYVMKAILYTVHVLTRKYVDCCLHGIQPWHIYVSANKQQNFKWEISSPVHFLPVYTGFK